MRADFQESDQDKLRSQELTKPSSEGKGYAAAAQSKRAWGGFFVKRERWGLSGKAKVLGGAGILLAVFWVHVWAYPFLAINEPVRGQVLVVDGWVPSFALAQAADEFTKGSYEQALVVRVVYDTNDDYESGRHNGEYVGNLLVQHGVPRQRLASLFPLSPSRDRTYHSALAVREWLESNLMAVDALDIATLGPHARRSRLLYEKAFGPAARIGVIALSDKYYDPKHWWRSSEGVREVHGEMLAYLYARFVMPLTQP